MRLEDCYRLLDLPPGASREDAKQAYRDLTKVWHPDRFAHDAVLRARAEEKLKAINAAYATILNSSGDVPRPRSGAGTWVVAFVLFAIIMLIRRPTAAGLAIAALLFIAAAVVAYRRRLRR